MTTRFKLLPKEKPLKKVEDQDIKMLKDVTTDTK